jgi:leucyl aminopeptidase
MPAAPPPARVEAVPADLLLFFQLEDEPAARGRLGRVDWLLCGALARLRARRKFAGERGGHVLLTSAGKLRAERVLIVGLGRREALTLNALYRLSYDVARAVLQLGSDSLAVEPPCRAFPQDPPGRIRRAFLEGFLAELRRGRPESPIQTTILD